MQTLVPTLQVTLAPTPPGATAAVSDGAAAAFAAVFLADGPAVGLAEGQVFVAADTAQGAAPAASLATAERDETFSDLRDNALPLSPVNAVPVAPLTVLTPMRLMPAGDAASQTATQPVATTPRAAAALVQTAALSAPVAQITVPVAGGRVEFILLQQPQPAVPHAFLGEPARAAIPDQGQMQVLTIPTAPGFVAPSLPVPPPATLPHDRPREILGEMPPQVAITPQGAAHGDPAIAMGRTIVNDMPRAEPPSDQMPTGTTQRRATPEVTGQIMQGDLLARISEAPRTVMQTATEMVLRAQVETEEAPPPPRPIAHAMSAVWEPGMTSAKALPAVPEQGQDAKANAAAPGLGPDQQPAALAGPRTGSPERDAQPQRAMTAEVTVAAPQEMMIPAPIIGLGADTGAALAALPAITPRAELAAVAPTRPMPVAMVPEAIVAAARAGAAEPVALRLDPVELGSVAFSIDMQATGLVVTIAAERPETLDLLRRHAEQFLADLRQSGFQGASLQFGPSDQSGQGHTQREQLPDPDGAAAPPTAPRFEPQPQSARPRDARGGLDLRL